MSDMILLYVGLQEKKQNRVEYVLCTLVAKCLRHFEGYRMYLWRGFRVLCIHSHARLESYRPEVTQVFDVAVVFLCDVFRALVISLDCWFYVIPVRW